VFDGLVAGGPTASDYIDHLSLSARYLRLHLERDVGGNHLIKNLKALVALGVFLDNARLLSAGVTELERQAAIQVLADGGHYERSPSYHCQVLGDLMDVAALLGAAGCPAVPGLSEHITGMRRWLGQMLLPDGDVPFFNDCTLVGRDRLALLEPAPPPPQRLNVLQPSGYVVARCGRIHLIADVGPPCPPQLPAHAHADCLSFELAVDGERVVVNTGTSTYQHGYRRAFERSTRAHNTVEIDGVDQSEVWGTFRAARLANATLECVADGATVAVVASHDGYNRLPGSPLHRRTWVVDDDVVQVIDDVRGTGVHRAAARIHLRPSERTPDVRSTPPSAEGEALLAAGFGRLSAGRALVAVAEGPLPLRLMTTITI
jgi:uncharacterized heparinase superfamily protein